MSGEVAGWAGYYFAPGSTGPTSGDPVPKKVRRDPWLPTGPLGAGLDAVPVQVCRYTPSTAISPGGTGPPSWQRPQPTSPYQVLPNVEAVTIRRDLTHSPSAAKVRYRWGTGYIDRDPQDMTEALSAGVSKPNTVEPEDRLVIRARRPDGVWVPLFDGFALSFEGRLSGQNENVPLILAGVEKRCYDRPVRGALWRQGDMTDTPEDPGGNPTDIRTAVVVHFNPKGKGNCVPGTDFAGPGTTQDHTAWGPAGEGGDKLFPTFLDAENMGDPAKPTATKPTSWTLSKAARYLLFSENQDEQYVDNPTGGSLDATLNAEVPKDGVEFDPTDPSTYDTAPITMTDKPVGGASWPDALWSIIGGQGFSAWWKIATGTDVYNSPTTAVEIFRPQARALKDVFLQGRSQAVDRLQTNVHELEIARDLHQKVTGWDVRGALYKIEASYVLAPLFPSSPGDAGQIEAFDASTVANNTDTYNKYRTFGLSESGEGYYRPGSTVLVREAPSLDDVLGAPDADGTPAYVRRRRVPLPKLVTKDSRGQEYDVRLWVSLDHATVEPLPPDAPGPPLPADPASAYSNEPRIWDGTGSWQLVTGNYSVLKDRVGIRFNCKNPNDLGIGSREGSPGPYPAGQINLIEAFAAAAPGKPAPKFRLTCAIRADAAVSSEADDTDAEEPTGYRVVRQVEAADSYARELVHPSSELFAGAITDRTAEASVAVRDDTAAAKAYSTALEDGTRGGVMTGRITIPYITDYYRPGDPIRSVAGRNLGLRTDQGGPAAKPIYPVVQSVEYEFYPRQKTHLHLSDANPRRRGYGKQLAKGKPHKHGR